MKRPGMNDVRVLLAATALIYGALALIMGVFPGIALSQTPPGPGVEPLTAQEDRGRAVFVAEGCSYCHTQEVRPLEQDRVFGRPTTRGDFAYQTPQLLGTERTGPDLSNVGARQPSTVWQDIHLYQPRALVHDSIMPAYPWLFDVTYQPAPGDVVVNVPKPYAPAQGVVVEGARARDLVAYLLALKQAPLPKATP